MAKFTKYNNPNRRKTHKKDTATAWNGAGSRDNYITSLIEIEKQKEKRGEKTI